MVIRFDEFLNENANVKKSWRTILPTGHEKSDSETLNKWNGWQDIVQDHRKFVKFIESLFKETFNPHTMYLPGGAKYSKKTTGYHFFAGPMWFVKDTIEEDGWKWLKYYRLEDANKACESLNLVWKSSVEGIAYSIKSDKPRYEVIDNAHRWSSVHDDEFRAKHPTWTPVENLYLVDMMDALEAEGIDLKVDEYFAKSRGAFIARDLGIHDN